MIYSNEHKEALRLQRELEKATKKQLELVDRELHRQKADPKYKDDGTFEKELKLLDQQEDLAYKRYSTHMHRCFDLGKNGDTSYNDKKYRDGFVDKKYINDMFRKKDQKERESKNKQNSSKKASQTASKSKKTTKRR